MLRFGCKHPNAVIEGYARSYEALAAFFEGCLDRAVRERPGLRFSARGEAPSNIDDS